MRGYSHGPFQDEKAATWPAPASVKETQQFLGFAGYYWRFLKDFAQVAWPLYRLTERPTTFVWTDKLLYRLTSAPILSYPDFIRQFTLDMDASATGIGAVLSQVGDDG